MTGTTPPENFLSEIHSGRINVFGLLTLQTVADYQEKGYDALSKVEEDVIFDLSEAEIVGSGVIALLISWQRRALLLGKGFAIENAPQHLLAMAEVSGLQDIMPFQN